MSLAHRRRTRIQRVRLRTWTTMLSVFAAVLAFVVAPVPGTATAATPAGPQGLIESKFSTFTTQSTGPEVQIGYLALTVSVPESEARCVRVESNVRAQTSIAGTTGDYYIKRNGTVRFGSSIYLAQIGGPGGSQIHVAGVDLLTAGTYNYTFWVKRTAGAGYFMAANSTGGMQQSWVEDLGAAVLDEFGGGNCPQ